MNFYIVVTPEMWTEGGWYEPSEPGVDCALVKARTRQEAKWAAWRLWKSLPSNQVYWPQWVRDNEWHPLHGLKVEYASSDELDPAIWEPYYAEAA